MIAEALNLTEEQSRELQALGLWTERHRLTDEQLIWVTECFPEFFEIKDEVFNMKE